MAIHIYNTIFLRFQNRCRNCSTFPLFNSISKMIFKILLQFGLSTGLRIFTTGKTEKDKRFQRNLSHLAFRSLRHDKLLPIGKVTQCACWLEWDKRSLGTSNSSLNSPCSKDKLNLPEVSTRTTWKSQLHQSPRSKYRASFTLQWGLQVPVGHEIRFSDGSFFGLFATIQGEGRKRW